MLGPTIVLLALVSVGLAVYAYNEHREVANLTLRADHLERRINEIEANAGLAEGEEVERLEGRVAELEKRTELQTESIFYLDEQKVGQDQLINAIRYVNQANRPLTLEQRHKLDMLPP